MPVTPAAANVAAISAAGGSEDSSPDTATDHFADDYLKINKTNFQVTSGRMNDKDRAFHDTLLDKTQSIVDAVTYKIWDDIEAKELEDKINADIKVELEPPAITKATAAVSFMMEGIDLANPPAELEDFLKVRFDQHTKPLRDELSKLKRDKRLNSSGAAKNQASTPIKSGGGSKKGGAQPTTSKPAKDKKKGKKKKAATQPAKITTPHPAANPTNSKKTKDKAKRAKFKSKSKKAGGNSQGESSKGGKGKGAVRR